MLDALEKVYPGTYGERESNEIRKSMENAMTQKFNRCATTKFGLEITSNCNICWHVKRTRNEYSLFNLTRNKYSYSVSFASMSSFFLFKCLLLIHVFC
jgi:hypothetical protein